MEKNKITLMCQKCNKLYSFTKDEWIDHVKKKHKDIENIRVGPELIKLKNDTKRKV